MKRAEILSQIIDIISVILDENEIEINESTRLLDIDGWDSLSMIQIVVGIEKQFKIKFKSLEYNTWLLISDLIDAIESKQ
jgi:acyl carrier protein